MDKSYLNDLLQRYLKGEASQEERKFIITYYNLFQDDPNIIDSMSAGQRAELKEMIRKSVWEKIALQEHRSRPRRLFSLRHAGITAAATIIIFVSVRFLAKRAAPEVRKAPIPATVINRESHVIVLPDGTSVILDSGSKLNYPSSFDGLAKREVFLTGQAFFDVRHLASRPFVVHAGEISVTVLGTAFNIKAVPKEGEITVTVRRGKVRVSHQEKTLGTILPREQIIYNIARSGFMQKKIADDHIFQWQDGDLVVDNLTISEAARVLEERFHVKITVSDSLFRSERFTAIFPRGDNLEQALKSICTFNNASYRYDAKGDVLIRFP